MDKKIIIFEEVSPFHRLIIWSYISRSFSVYYYRINASAQSKKWVARYIDKGLIRQIGKEHDFYSVRVGSYPDLAYQNIAKVSGLLLSGNEIVKYLTALYGDVLVSNAFNKYFFGELARFYYINHIMAEAERLFAGRKIYFVHTLTKEMHRTHVIDVDSYRNYMRWTGISGAFRHQTGKAVFPLWFTVISRLYRAGRFFTVIINLAGLIAHSCAYSAINRVKTPNPKKRNFRFGVMIINPVRQFANGIHKIDFLFDGKNITKQNTIFISWKRLPEDKRRYLRSEGFNYADDLLKGIMPAAKGAIAGAFFMLGRVFKYRDRIFLVESATAQLACYSIWRSFSQNYRLDNLVSHADFGQQSIARNILLSKEGTKSWDYADAISWSNFYFTENTPANIARYNHTLGFIYYDYFISWSDEVIEYFKRHQQNIGNYINVGCLWAQYIKELSGPAGPAGLKNRLSAHGFKTGHKLITVFDSTYTYYVSTYEEGTLFIQHIYKLLEELPDIFILFKEKKPRSYVSSHSRQMSEHLEKLEKHPRCLMGPVNMSSAEAIASSDLVISFPFTSPTFEALSAGKKAIYYDVAGKYRGCFYDKIDGILCHDYDELKKRIFDLLFRVDAAAYERYLDRFVKGRVEPYLDGKAINRFRALLTNGTLREA